jgi:hypothetical protein
VNWTAPPMWSGGTTFIIGGGPSMPRQFGVPEDVVSKVMTGALSPSAYSPFLTPIHGAHVIGVNNAYQIGPWIDCNFFGDCAWYLVHRQSLAKLSNLKVSCCPRFAGRPQKDMEGVKYLSKGGGRQIEGGGPGYGLSDNPAKVCWNHNSGAAAISLAVHFGVKRIILLGFDMCLDGQVSHWHGSHGNKKPPPFIRHLKGFPVIAEDAKRRGVEILNISSTSSIESFPKVTLKEIL